MKARFLTKAELCRRWGVSPQLLEKLKSDGVIPTLSGNYALKLMQTPYILTILNSAKGGSAS
jgi:hypothetical protein